MPVLCNFLKIIISIIRVLRVILNMYINICADYGTHAGDNYNADIRVWTPFLLNGEVSKIYFDEWNDGEAPNPFCFWIKIRIFIENINRSYG